MTAGWRYMPAREQLALVEEIEPAIAAVLPITRLHDERAGEPEAVWSGLAELGLFTAGLDEAQGGLGLSAVEQALIAIVLGRSLASPAIIDTFFCHSQGHVSDRAGTPLPVTAGRIVPDGGIWIDEPCAGIVLLHEDAGAVLHETDCNAQDATGSVWGAGLRSGTQGPLLRRFGAKEMRLHRLLYAGALAGLALATVDKAVDYAKTREQFGRAIGSFQAIKHHCANMAIAARSAHDLTLFAAVALADDRPDVGALIESAFLVAAQAAIGNAGTNIQVHGGIGFSAEADPHLFLKRAHLFTALGGGLEQAAVRVSQASSEEVDA